MATKTKEQDTFKSTRDFERAMFPRHVEERERAEEEPQDLGARLAKALVRGAEKRVKGE
jgi:hypothetical protein